MDVQVVGSEPEPSPRMELRSPKWLVAGLVAVAVVFVVIALSRADRSVKQFPPSVFAGVPVQLFNASGPTIPVVPPSAATRVDPPVTVGGASIEPTSDANLVEGYVALTSSEPTAANRTLWTLGPGGSVAARTDLLVGTDGPPPLVTDRFVAFTDTEFGMVVDASLVGEPVVMADASHVVPSDAKDRVWFVASVDRGLAATEVGLAPGDSEVVGVYKRPFRLGPDGLEEAQEIDATRHRVGLWGSGTVVSLNSVQSAPVGVVRVAISSSSGLLRSKLVPAQVLPALSKLEDDDGGVSTMCVARGSGRIAAVSDKGTLILVDADGGAAPFTKPGVHPVNGVGWTSPDQLVFLSEVGGVTEVRSIDALTGVIETIAVLSGSTEWTLTASASSC